VINAVFALLASVQSFVFFFDSISYTRRRKLAATSLPLVERAYVRGDLFSAVSASCVSIERLLNLARIRLHEHHQKIKELWNGVVPIFETTS
jgi:hypothetical protein